MFYGAWLSTLSILFQWATGGVCVQCSVQNVGKCDIVSLQFVTRKRYKGKHLLRWKVGCTAAPLVAFQKLLTPPIWKPSMADWQRRIFIKAYSPQFMESFSVSCSCKQSCLVLETSPTCHYCHNMKKWERTWDVVTWVTSSAERIFVRANWGSKE